MPTLGSDMRTGVCVKIQNTRKDACKSNKAVTVSSVTSDDPRFTGMCVPHHTMFIPGGIVNNEYLCEYPDGSISWVDGKHIMIHEK